MIRENDNVQDSDLIPVIDDSDDSVQILGVSAQGDDAEDLPVQSVEIDGGNAIFIDVDDASADDGTFDDIDPST